MWVRAERAPGVSAGHHRTVAVGVGLRSAARGGLEEGAAEGLAIVVGPRRGPGGARAGPGRHAVDAREVAGAVVLALEPAVDRAPRGACRPKSEASSSSAPAGACRGSSRTPVIVSLLFLGSWGLSPVVPFVPLPRTARRKKSAHSARKSSLPATWVEAAGRVNGGGGARGRVT